ncbi:MAG: Xaa-Pro peptidase family protein [Acidaminococcaceae bacterium]|nr:Xaa-Pro peptidase family protein [Acidaminococcaceae bacterium]
MEKLLALLDEQKLTGIFVKGDISIRYFTGFTGGDSLLYVDDNRKIIITDSRYTLQAKNEAPECEIIEHKGGFWSEVAKLNLSGTSALDGDYFSYSEQCALAAAVPNVTFKNINLVSLRQVKTQRELDLIVKAVEISDTAFTQLIPCIKEGVSEMELAAQLEFNMRKLGSEGVAFETIVASGARSALPHGLATAKLVTKGDFITFDFGAVYKGYRSDITRTLVMGRAFDWQRDIYEIVLQANLLGESTVKSGITGCEVDAKVRKFIADSGYGAYFGHGLGHGVGLDIHEKPVLSRSGGELLLPVNSVVTVEPGIYIPGKGGVRIEDTVVVTQEGCHVLTATPKQLQEIG